MERRGVIAPSIFAADALNLEKECTDVLDSGAQWLHVDIMDGHFCPNISLGFPVVQSLRKKWPNLFLDCHMMVTKPEDWVETLKGVASCFVFHIEATVPSAEERSTITAETPSSDPKFARTLAFIETLRAAGIRPGVAVSPETPAETIFPLLSHVDYALVMTVRPGFSFQKFMPDCVPKVRAIRDHAASLGEGVLPLGVGVDGGVSADNACSCGSAGATTLVAGGGVFKAEDRAKAIAQLQKAIEAEKAPLTHTA